MKDQKGAAAVPSARNETSRQPEPKKKALTISIYDLLKYGKKNRMTTLELLEITGTDERTLRGMVRRERIAGKLIAATKEHGGGYYIPDGPEEIQEFLDTMGKEARSIFYMMKSAREALKEQKRGEKRHDFVV